MFNFTFQNKDITPLCSTVIQGQYVEFKENILYFLSKICRLFALQKPLKKYILEVLES